MKKILALAIVLASVITSAQTGTATTAPAATTNEAAPAAATPVAKGKVKKAKKKAAKPSAQATKIENNVALTQKETGTATTAVATENKDKEAVQAAATAAGTTTAAVSDVSSTKKWGGAIKMYSTDDMSDMKNIQTLTSVGASYKVSDKLTLKAAQTFETLTVGDGLSDSAKKREMVDQSNFRPSHLDLTAATKLPGFWGSNEVAASFNYRAMGADAVYTTIGSYKSVYSMFEANASIPYSIAPKVDLSIETQWRHNIAKKGPNTNRVLAIPYLSYAFNDVFSVYQAAGGILSMRDNTDFRRNYTRGYLETGVSITPVKNFNISLDISQDKVIQSSNDGVDVTNWTPYSNQLSANGATEADRAERTIDAVAYEMYISYSF
ncbi:MAG: hypothetical protein H7256_15400 [Bdellovibrio sp.]|nr:hypothetical protein [Bdellovibrio sp.]